jgi:hypothetical protein
LTVNKIDVTASEETKKGVDAVAAKPTGYQTPEVVEVGKATDMIQGYLYGAYSDGYTGYYWDR